MEHPLADRYGNADDAPEVIATGRCDIASSKASSFSSSTDPSPSSLPVAAPSPEADREEGRRVEAGREGRGKVKSTKPKRESKRVRDKGRSWRPSQ
jgi:hypothetical protein